MDQITNKKINTWLEEFKIKVKKKYSPKKIILFGSRARKDNLLESDIDLIIISDKFKNINWSKRLGDVSVLWDGLITLEPLCYTPEEFEEKSKQIGIVQQAIKEGIEI